MESEGKARVHIKKTGYLKQFSMVSCRTQSHTAKSNRDTKLYDFVHTHSRLEFNEDESYKACDIVLNRDDQTEPIESFWVQLDEAKYSIVGLNNRIKVPELFLILNINCTNDKFLMFNKNKTQNKGEHFG